jgi:predicted RNase H-like HicB family nuclease
MVKSLDKLAEILRRPYTWVLVPEEDGGYSARIEEFSGCFAQGDTVEETVTNLHRAGESWLLAVIERGQTIPEPLGGMVHNLKCERDAAIERAKKAEGEAQRMRDRPTVAEQAHSGLLDEFTKQASTLLEWKARAEAAEAESAELRAALWLVANEHAFAHSPDSGPFFACAYATSDGQFALSLNANDIFAWATADAEPFGLDLAPMLAQLARDEGCQVRKRPPP